MMIGGADTSWNANGLNEHTAFVIGNMDDVNMTLKQLGYSYVHMRDIKDEETRNDIIDRLNFNDHDILSICVKTERNETVRMIKKNRTDPLSIKRIWRDFDYELFRRLDEEFIKYLAPRKHTLSDITYQCDADCRPIIKTKGFRYAAPGNIHSLADITAFGNTHENRPKGVIERNVVAEIRQTLTRKYGK